MALLRSRLARQKRNAIQNFGKKDWELVNPSKFLETPAGQAHKQRMLAAKAAAAAEAEAAELQQQQLQEEAAQAQKQKQKQKQKPPMLQIGNALRAFSGGSDGGDGGAVAITSSSTGVVNIDSQNDPPFTGHDHSQQQEAAKREESEDNSGQHKHRHQQRRRRRRVFGSAPLRPLSGTAVILEKKSASRCDDDTIIVGFGGTT